MGRATEGVRGMSLRQSDEVIAASLAENDADVLVVTRNGFGKRTPIRDYPVKGRGGLGVQTVKLTEARGELAGALVVRDGYQIMLMSTGGTVIKVPVEDVKRLGRSTQGVIVMRTRDGEEVSTLAPVVDQPDVPEVGQGEDEAAEAPAEAADEAPVEAEAVAEPGADE
jgi:DNA gyrase subunit A